jgi:hypothetical protein
LVKEGVTVFGPRPTGSVFFHDAEFIKQYQQLINQLWATEKSGAKKFIGE